MESWRASNALCWTPCVLGLLLHHAAASLVDHGADAASGLRSVGHRHAWHPAHKAWAYYWECDVGECGQAGLGASLEGNCLARTIGCLTTGCCGRMPTTGCSFGRMPTNGCFGRNRWASHARAAWILVCAFDSRKNPAPHHLLSHH